ncbi:MAG: DUF2085 domain-containing protein [Pyrinomonadaceae bacterium]
MNQQIENYTSQIVIKQQKRQAFWAWSVVFSIACVWIFLIVSAPLARIFGFENYAHSIYTFFSYLCHQMEWRSFHIDNEPLAVCARCFGFYAGFLLGVIIYPFFRTLNNTEPLPRLWLFLAMIPMGVDWSLTFFGIWENTHFSRLATGLILGAACAFFIIPAAVEISYFLGGKLQRKT